MKRIFAIVCIALFTVALIPWGARTVLASGTHYYVSMSGSDTNDGKSSATPFKTIQKAVNLAYPGDVVNLAAGVYPQDIKSYRHGSASSPITIQGPATAVIKGAGNMRVIQITHDYITVDGFTVDGLFGNPDEVAGYRKKLLYAIGTQPLDGVTGLKILRMTFKNALDECVRIRYFSQWNEMAYSSVANCGIEDFRFNGGSKNGEGVYVGTADEQLGLNGAPTADPDLSNNNWFHHNTINTQGAECFNVKEAASGNIIEDNTCTGELDSISAGIEIRGNANIIRRNGIYGNTGGGVKLFSDVVGNGLNNQVYDNNIHDNANGGIKIHNSPQGQICGNTMANNTGGNSIGPYGAQYNPTAPCTQPTATAVPSATATATSTAIPPTATNTPVPATSTPTNTAVPTNTPTATNTPVPPTPTATNTPLATNTPIPMATNTPTATNIPTATATNMPTATATNTPTASANLLPAPSNLVVTSSSKTQITIGWTDNATSETGFSIERSTNGTNYSQIATVAANTTSYRNNGLTGNTTYYYRVRAYNGSIYSDFSNVVSKTTPRK